MKNNKITTVSMILLTTLTVSSCCHGSHITGHLTQAKPIDSLSVATIFKDLGVELQYVKTRLANDPSIKVNVTEADVVLDNIVTDAATGTLSLLIFNPGYTYTGINEFTVTFSLLSVDKSQLPKEEHLDSRNLAHKFTLGKTERLSDLIYTTAKTLNSVPLVLDDDPTKTVQKNAEIDIKFSIDNNYALELKPTILGVGVDVKGSYDDANAQTLKVMFSVKGK